MSPHLDPRTDEMAVAAPGPGVFEWGTLSFKKPPYSSGMPRPTIEVELDEQDGSVVIRWTEPADDCYGTSDRQCSFTGEEFAQLVVTRGAAMARRR